MERGQATRASNQQVAEGMAWLTGCEFTMGSQRYYPEERPRRRARVDGFWIDPAPVTNREFEAFVQATGHRTVAEVPLDPGDYPGLAPGMTAAGSLVFERSRGPVRLDNPGNWWQFRIGACWREPLGPGSSLEGLDDHPVVHIAYALQVDDAVYLFDVGNGVLRRMDAAELPLAEVVQAGDLPADIDSPTVVYEDGKIKVGTISVNHFQVPPSVPMREMPRAVAYRVEVDGRSYVYSGDTGPSQNLQTLPQAPTC